MSQQASAGLEEVSLFVAERMSKTCWWKNFKRLLWLWYLLSRGCTQATVPPQKDTHGDSSSIPLIWETHIRVSCVTLLTNSRVTICHLQHPETVSTYFLSYRRSFILFFLFLDKYNIKLNCMLLLEKENNLFYSRLALWTTHPESWTTKIIVFLKMICSMSRQAVASAHQRQINHCFCT